MPVVACGLVIGVGRVGTIVKDAMRVDFTIEMEDSDEHSAEARKGSIVESTLRSNLLKSPVDKITGLFIF